MNTYTFSLKFFLAASVLFSAVETGIVYALPTSSTTLAAPAKLRGRSYRILDPGPADVVGKFQRRQAPERLGSITDQTVPLGRTERFQAVQEKRDIRRRRDVQTMTTNSKRGADETLLSHNGAAPAPAPAQHAESISGSPSVNEPASSSSSSSTVNDAPSSSSATSAIHETESVKTSSSKHESSLKSKKGNSQVKVRSPDE